MSKQDKDPSDDIGPFGWIIVIGGIVFGILFVVAFCARYWN